MKQLLLIISLIYANFNYAQSSNEDVFKKGLNKLEEGYTLESSFIFTELNQSDKNNPKYISYLNYSNSKLLSFQDSVNNNKLEELYTSVKKSYLLDSTNIINQFAYANTLFIKSKYTKQKKEKASLLITTKYILDKIINNDSKHADSYNLLAIWNRTVANFDSFELEMMKTFFGAAPIGASYENAIKFHKIAFELKRKSEYQYELALTYKNIGVDDAYINALNAGVDIHGDSSDDVLFEKKCDEKLPKLGH